MYKCPAGKNTIGCGHNCDANPLPSKMQSFLDKNGYITNESIDELLEMDIKSAETDARKLFAKFDTYPVNRQAAIVDLLFNMGMTTFSKFVHAIDAIRHGDWKMAAMELQNSDWYKKVGKRGPKIVQLILGEIEPAK